MPPAVQRASHAASCPASTPRQPNARLRAECGADMWHRIILRRSARATATRRSSSATWPTAERQRQIQRSGNGRSGVSVPIAEAKRRRAHIATALSVPSVRQAPRSSSSRKGSIPSPASPNVASTRTSTPSRSKENRSNCNPVARSASESSRSSWPATMIPLGVRTVLDDEQDAAAHVQHGGPVRISPWLASAICRPARS